MTAILQSLVNMLDKQLQFKKKKIKEIKDYLKMSPLS